jgi:hypothetical protein
MIITDSHMVNRFTRISKIAASKAKKDGHKTKATKRNPMGRVKLGKE